MATILVVDDESVIHHLMSRILERLGHRVLVAGDGQEALDRLAEAAVDLVITDYEMPTMNGLTLLRKVRGTACYRNIPVILLSASGQVSDYRNAEAEGINLCLEKPVSSHDLITAVRQLLP